MAQKENTTHQPKSNKNRNKNKLALWTSQAFCIFLESFPENIWSPKVEEKTRNVPLLHFSYGEKVVFKTQPTWHKMMISWAFLYIHKGTIYKFIYRMWCATWTSFRWRQIWCSVSTSPGQCSQRIWCKFPRQSNSTVVLPWVYNLDMPRNILVWIESLSYKMWTKTYTSWQLKNLRPYPAIIF